MSKSIASLSRRINKLSGGGAPPLSTPEWADDFSDFALMRDRSWRQWCSLDRFVIGRSALLACLWGGRLVNGYAYWHRHKEPDWWSNAVWRAKTPDWQEQVERERSLYCPKENRTSMALFLEWFYSDAPRQYEGIRPWTWASRDTGSPYYWPLMHSLAIAASTWLIDDLGMKPRLVQDAALFHHCAFKWRTLHQLTEAALPPRPITGSSPVLPLRKMAEWCKAHGIPIDEERVENGEKLELLELLMCVPSGCGGPHDHEMIFPSLTVLAP